jgi:hypothetical protein
VFDARHFQPDGIVVVPVPAGTGFSFTPNNTGALTPNNTGAGGHPTWIIAANLAYHLAYLLLARQRPPSGCTTTISSTTA